MKYYIPTYWVLNNWRPCCFFYYLENEFGVFNITPSNSKLDKSFVVEKVMWKEIFPVLTQIKPEELVLML